MGVVGVDVGGDRRGEMPADPPPQRGGDMVIRQWATGGGGGTEQLRRVHPGTGDRRQPVDERGGERILGHAGDDLVEQPAPFLQRRGQVASHLAVEVPLPGPGRVAGSRWSTLRTPTPESPRPTVIGLHQWHTPSRTSFPLARRGYSVPPGRFANRLLTVPGYVLQLVSKMMPATRSAAALCSPSETWL